MQMRVATKKEEPATTREARPLDLYYGRLIWYFILRVEKPRATKRRQLYRSIEKEKLRLAELGINWELIKRLADT